MADHHDLVAEIPTVEKMATQDRLKHAKKRRAQQLKKWANYEKQLEKENSKRKKSSSHQSSKRHHRSNRPRIRFPGKIVLLEAAARNDIDDVRRLLTQGVNPDSTNEDGLTALHQCCIDDSEDMLKLLLEFGANVNARDSELWTPLHAAATCGHVHLCKHLIDKGAELLAVNADGNMPYDICEDEVTLDYIETEMAKRGVTQEEIDETRLIPEKEMLEDMKYLADKGKDLEYYSRDGTTPLHIAAANGFLEVAEFLLDHHVSVDMKDKDSWLPIHAAACWLQPEMLELLVRNGADIDAKTKNGETAFDLCEDAEIKQKILDMKDEIENNKASRTKDNVRRHKHNTRSWSYSSPASLYSSSSSLNDKAAYRHSDPHSSHSASIRRSSMRGEKNPLFMKEAKEEALHFGWVKSNDDIVEDDKENMPATNLDEVELIIDEKTDREKETSLIETALNGDSGETKREYAHHITDTIDIRNRQSSDKNKHQTTQQTEAVTKGDKPTKRQPSFTRKSDQRKSIESANSTLSPGTIPEQETSNNNSSVRYPSGTPSLSLSDLKKHRQENRRESNTIDTQVQDLFLSSLNSDTTKKYSSSSPTSRDQETSSSNHKNKNGHNNNMENYRHSDGLRRFKAPSHAPVVGEEEKQGCCVIM